MGRLCHCGHPCCNPHGTSHHGFDSLFDGINLGVSTNTCSSYCEAHAVCLTTARLTVKMKFQLHNCYCGLLISLKSKWLIGLNPCQFNNLVYIPMKSPDNYYVLSTSSSCKQAIILFKSPVKNHLLLTEVIICILWTKEKEKEIPPKWKTYMYMTMLVEEHRDWCAIMNAKYVIMTANYPAKICISFLCSGGWMNTPYPQPIESFLFYSPLPFAAQWCAWLN